MGVFKHLVAGVLAVSTWALLRMQNDFGPRDVFFPPAEINAPVEAQFSNNYYEARALFRQRASGARATLHALPLDGYAHLDLSVDVAVIKGAADKVIVHLSGTHGVEGFAGSAIQSGILSNWTSAKNGPTVVLVHAVNPFGFALLRRFNEHNVDLNRNWLTDAQFKAVCAADPNKFGYVDTYVFLNPTSDSFKWENWYWPRALYELVTRGFGAVKQSVVSGNYHFPTSVYYGGDKIEPSLAMLREFLTTHLDLPAITKLAVVDVHTGLGRSGEDTLMLMSATAPGFAERVFHQEFRAGQAVQITNPSNPVTQGYEEVVGLVAQGIAELLPSPTSAEVVAFAQEFGTVPGVFVLKATVQENAFFQYAPSRRLAYAERLRDVFYTHGSASWKEGVLERGVAVFRKLLKEFAA